MKFTSITKKNNVKQVTRLNKGNKLNSKKQVYTRTRFYLVYGFILLAIISLLVRLAILQIIEPDKLIAEANKRSIRHQEMSALRAMF